MVCPVKPVLIVHDDDDLFSYCKPQDASSLSPVAVQQDNYLSSPSTSIDCLASYPHVMNAFRPIKANSMLPSSAAVEHMFNAYEGLSEEIVNVHQP